MINSVPLVSSGVTPFSVFCIALLEDFVFSAFLPHMAVSWPRLSALHKCLGLPKEKHLFGSCFKSNENFPENYPECFLAYLFAQNCGLRPFRNQSVSGRRYERNTEIRVVEQQVTTFFNIVSSLPNTAPDA